MFTSVQRAALLIAIAGLAIAVAVGIAQAQGQSGQVGSGSGSGGTGKLIPVYPTASVTHKHTTPTTPISSCPMPAPQPGLITLGLPHNPTYVFQSMAIGVSGGQPYAIYSGYVLSKPTQGVFLVQMISLDPCKTLVTQMQNPSSPQSDAMTAWNAPAQYGAITITAVSGSTVSFTTAGGKTGRFNYVTKTILP